MFNILTFLYFKKKVITVRFKDIGVYFSYNQWRLLGTTQRRA
ncbi:MAG: KRAB domain-containing protein [Deltaproteobacteria bacterium]|nr:KRAB domain-containing protein [Deltaproteobacteria bacterium]